MVSLRRLVAASVIWIISSPDSLKSAEASFQTGTVYLDDARDGKWFRLNSELRSVSMAIVVGPEQERDGWEFESKEQWEEWRRENERLREGEEWRFEEAGNEIGRTLLEGLVKSVGWL